MKTIFLLSCVFFIASLDATNAQKMTKHRSTETADSSLARLVSYMEGSFSSEVQSIRDTSYFDIRLHIKRIWTDRNDAYWLYVEQAVAKFMERPYRQRVYKVTRLNSDTLVSSVYEMRSPLRFAGAWKESTPLSSLSPDSIVERQGCSVYLVKSENGTFVGATKPNTCLSDLRGAKFASSEVTISETMLLSWDRGWGMNGEQMWGATKGGYEFVKIKE